LRRIGFSKGEWSRAAQLFEKYNRKVVVKPNQGTMGQEVFLCETISKLEAAVHAVFQNHPDAALSPYHEIENEYRIFFLNDDACFVYGKSKGATWQHNLSQGATAFEVCDEKKLQQLKNLAERAAKCIGITFASIDIAELSSGELAVMEINSGVQSQQLLEQLPHLRPIIKNIFANAVKLLLE
jgi:glutathione synthase/RimK-type ligase-like ATP-grasp enzyme